MHRALQHGIYSLNSHYPGQLSRVSLFQAFSFWGQHKKMWKEKLRGLSRAKEGSLLSPPLPPYFFPPPLRLCASFQILNAWNRLELSRPLHRFRRDLCMERYCVGPMLKIESPRIGVIRGLSIFNIGPTQYRSIHKSRRNHRFYISIRYIVNIALSSLLATPTNASINHAIFYSRLSNFLVRVTPKIPDKTLSL